MTNEQPAPRAVFVSRHTATFGTQYELAADELIIGRAQDAGLILDSSSVSRRHARMSWTGDTYGIEDLDSTNGTWINDRRLTDTVALTSGDVVRFGDLPFVFSLDTSTAATMTIVSAPTPSLVTILFTDMESSTALTQQLGDEAAQELLHTHNTIVRDALKAHQGNEIKHTGDGIMASFPSASGALECAVYIQRALTSRDQGTGDAVRVRIGLNAGEPVAEDEDLFGTAVQLARRICDHARPEQILVPDAVRHLAAGKKFLFVDLGEVVLKGFEEPVKLWEVSWSEDE